MTSSISGTCGRDRSGSGETRRPKIGHDGLRRVEGQRAQSRALAPGEQDGLHDNPSILSHSAATMAAVDMNLPNSLTLTSRIFLVPLLVVVLLTKFEGGPSWACRARCSGAAIFGRRLAHRLARRLPGAPPEAGHDARPVDGPARRQAAHRGGLHLAGPDGRGAGVDGGRHHRPRVRRHRPAQHRLRARAIVIASSPLGKAKMTSQVVAILLLILGHDGTGRSTCSGRPRCGWWWSLSVVSAVDYYRKFARAASPF